MTAHVDYARKPCNMRCVLFNKHCKSGNCAAQSLRTDAELVDMFKRFCFKLCVKLIGMGASDIPQPGTENRKGCIRPPPEH